MKPRHLLLALALAATLVAAFWPRPQEAEVVGAVAKARTTQARVAPAADAHDPQHAPQLGAMRADLFPAQTWQPPPPPPAKRVELPPPPPMAPPLPFQYLGRWKEGGKDVIFLDQGSRVLQARVGDTLAGWHLDQVGDDALVFTWIALNMQQTLRISP
ncbi:MAG: hypothetical protein PHD37_17045 [Gallionellaceae bacterium]|nr:hypothetical protein [Gallionellaceae bacterium]